MYNHYVRYFAPHHRTLLYKDHEGSICARCDHRDNCPGTLHQVRRIGKSGCNNFNFAKPLYEVEFYV